jgi:general stress protein YciG
VTSDPDDPTLRDIELAQEVLEEFASHGCTVTDLSLAYEGQRRSFVLDKRRRVFEAPKGQPGGMARAVALSPEERQEIARSGGEAASKSKWKKIRERVGTMEEKKMPRIRCGACGKDGHETTECPDKPRGFQVVREGDSITRKVQGGYHRSTAEADGIYVGPARAIITTAELRAALAELEAVESEDGQ